VAFVLTVLPPPAQQWLAAGLRSTVLAPFVWTQQTLAEARLRATEAGNLQARVDSLTTVLIGRGALSEENRRLRSLLGLQARVGADVIPASVMRAGTPGGEGTFTLDVGLADGVSVNDPVVVAQGLVGVVREVAETYAIAMDWTHPDFRASAMTDDGQVYGIIEPRHGDFREVDRLLWSGAPFHTDLRRGLGVETSGFGGVYPRGIPLGVIDTLASAEAGWRKSYWLTPAVVPGSVTHVLVVVNGGGLQGGRSPQEWWTRPEENSIGPGVIDIPPPVPSPVDTGGVPPL
jgi:rod shape-determining protein MreC